MSQLDTLSSAVTVVDDAPSDNAAIDIVVFAGSPPAAHVVLHTAIMPPYPKHARVAVFAMGCFWGAERRFWQQLGVITTAVGYCAGATESPNYEAVCSGETGHAEAVLVVFDHQKIGYEDLLTVFWEAHNPTQGMRQGNDIGTQYRSGVYYVSEDQKTAAAHSLATYSKALESAASDFGGITTEIQPLSRFYLAEEYHQQYLAKNPNGYCGLGGTGVSLC